MFGYVRARIPDLRVREYTCYRAYYCGVCRALGKHTGTVSRFGLMHEAAVLAMVLDVCSGTGVGRERLVRRPCIVHPLHKVISVRDCDVTAYAAAVNVLLVRAKLQDAWRDERRMYALAALPLWRCGAGRAARAVQAIDERFRDRMEALHALERDGCREVDAAAEPFAALLASVFTMDGLMPAPVLEDLRQLGYHLGKWIYLADAAEDREKDRKRGSFNVYNARYGTEELPESEHFTRELSLAACARSWEALKRPAPEDAQDAVGYLDNLFYLGLRAAEERLAAGLPLETREKPRKTEKGIYEQIP